MTEKIHPSPPSQQGDDYDGNANSGNDRAYSSPDEEDPEDPKQRDVRLRAKSGKFTSIDIQAEAQKELVKISKKKARHKADSIFDIGKALNRSKSFKATSRRHTMLALSRSSTDASVKSELDDDEEVAQKSGRNGERKNTKRDADGNTYFDIQKSSTRAALDIRKDVKEMEVILDALDPEQQQNLKRHLREALSRVNKNVGHLNFMKDRADHMALKLVRAANWAHSKEVRKKRLTIRHLSFSGKPAGGHGQDQASALIGKISGSTLLGIFCLLTLVCMLVSSKYHSIDYKAFQHVEAVSTNTPYVRKLNSSPLDVVECTLTKDTYKSDEKKLDGFVTVELVQWFNTSTTQVQQRVGRQMVVDLSLGQVNKFHLRFFPKRAENFLSDEEIELKMEGPFNSSLETIIFKTHIQQHGQLGLWQEYIGAAILFLILGIISLELLDRTLSAMLGASLMIGLLVLLNKTPDLKTIISWCDEGTLGLLFGMMVIVSKLSLTGFMDLMTYKLIPFCHGSKYRLLYILCGITAVMSAFLDNVTTVLLVAPLTVSLARSLKMNPLPFLTGEVLFSNIGGTATLIGDPPNVIVGSRLSDSLTFTDFIISLGPAVVLMSLPCMLVIISFYRKELSGPLTNVNEVLKKSNEGIKDPELFTYCLIVLSMVLFGFLLHPIHHVNPAWIAISGAIMLLMFSSPHDIEPALESVEWSTLLFFAALFVMVEGMVEVGLIQTIGGCLSDLIEGVDDENRLLVAIVLVMWISALVSAFLDNIPYTATMVPIIVQLSSSKTLGLDIKPLAWALCFGACLGGNGSLMGASANIVVAGIADKSGYPLTFKDFFYLGFRVMIVSVTISTGYMLMIYCT